MAGYDFENDNAAWRAFVDVTPRGIAPAMGLNLLTAELGAGVTGDRFQPTIAAIMRLIWLRGGVEYDLNQNRFAATFSAQFGLRRGGLFGIGDEFRVEYRPSDQVVMLGMAFNQPFRRYTRTRPQTKFVRLPNEDIPEPSRAIRERSLDDSLSAAVASIDHAVRWMDALLTPRFEAGRHFAESATEYRDHIRKRGHTFNDEVKRYHEQMDHAFSLALGDDDAGARLAAAAEKVIFEEVVVPYDRLFGENKMPRDARGFASAAYARFATMLREYTDTPPTDPNAARARTEALEVFRRLLASINDATHTARRRWQQKHLWWLRQSRLVWLPLNLGIRADQYDSQAEWNGVVEALTHSHFHEGNTLRYVINSEFANEFRRLLLETEVYHVVWIHDFQGRHADGLPDQTGWRAVADGYIEAFTRAVQNIDKGERQQLPQFMMFLDQNFYEANRSRQIVTFMEHIYDGDVPKFKDDELRNHVIEARERMVAAISSSPTFQHLDERRLRELFKVHVSITHPYDPSFAFDAAMRDHRKIVFRDVFEDDPASGVAIVTGQGVGDGYVGPLWEDRSIVLSGPVLAEFKTAARDLFLSQGYDVSEVPFYLRPLPGASHPGSPGEGTSEILTAFNGVGYRSKRATVLKATMYNLAPARSSMFTFDSLWISDFWAGMFISAALRGARMHAVAPSPRNAPSSAQPTLSLMRENLDLMIRARGFFADDLARAGGDVRAGVYLHNLPVSEIAGRMRAIGAGRSRYPFLKERFPFNPAVEDMLRDAASRGDTIATTHANPFLHLKVQFFATETALKILSLEEWRIVLRDYVDIRMHQIELGSTSIEGITPQLLRKRRPRGYLTPNLLEAFEAQLAGRDDVIFALTIGSHNQDRRGMLLDGEVLGAIGGYDALVALTDIMFIVGTSSWPATHEEFEEVFPEIKGPNLLKRWFRYVQDLI